MLRLLNFVNRPNKFKNRPRIHISHVQLQNFEGYTFTFNVLGSKSSVYTCIIQFATKDTDDKITLRTPVKVYCSCPNFKYDFAYLLGEADALYGGSFEDLVSGKIEANIATGPLRKFLSNIVPFKRMYKHPPKKNTIPYICKHLEACLQYIALRYT